MCQEHYASHTCTHRIYLGIWTCPKRSTWARLVSVSDPPCMEGTHIDYVKTLCSSCLSAHEQETTKTAQAKMSKRTSFAVQETAKERRKRERLDGEREEREQEHWRRINDEFWRYCEEKKTLPVTILEKWKPVRREENWKWNV